jgi:hypothetical protein
MRQSVAGVNLPGSGGTAKSYKAEIDMVRSTLLPRLYTTGPPNLNTQTAFPKTLTVTCNKLTQDNPSAGTTGTSVGQTRREKVPTSQGAVIWQPNRGAGSLYTFGIVPSGASSDCLASATTNVAINREIPAAGSQPYYPPSGLALIVSRAGNGASLTYNYPVAVPYNNTNPNDLIQISPNLSASFSLVRLFSGDLRVICDTVPIGNTALNGYLSAGAFTDSRDVTQVPQSGGLSANCLDPSDLVQTSVTRKEGLKEINCMKGIITLVGSDIQPFYAPPQTDITDVVNAGWKAIDIPVLSPGFSPAVAPPDAHNISTTVAAAFFSPWNISCSESGTNPVQYFNQNLNPSNINGSIDIQLVLGATDFRDAPAAVPAYQWRLRVTFTSIFGNCTSGPTYAMSYLSQSEVTFVDFGGTEPFQGDPATIYTKYPVYQGVVNTNPRMHSENMTNAGTGGMYLGTQVMVAWEYPGQQLDGATAPATLQQSPTLTYIVAQIRERSLYNPGELGPTRVIRWDSIGDGQIMKFDGCINCQCIPEGTIAPFVQGQAMFSETAHNLNIMTMLSELYNGNTPISRTYVLEEYLQHAEEGGLFQSFGPEHILQWANPKLTGTASAAGIFGELGGKAGHFLGSLAGDALGGLFGADGRYNAAGSQYLTGVDRTNPQGAFGRREASARGQFGASGEFGALGAPQFGARSSASRRSHKSHKSTRSKRRRSSVSSRGSSVM